VRCNKNFQVIETWTTTNEDVVIETVYIEPKYQCHAIGENECVLRVLEETYNVAVLFNDVNNKIVINGLRENLKRCKADIDLNMSVRRC